VPAEGVSRIQVAIDGAFAEHGFGQPTMFTVTAAGGASRDR
jgi:galactokinase